MRNHRSSMIAGAAVAAALTLPATAADNGWLTWPTKTVNGNTLRIENVVGKVRISVAPGPMKLNVSGRKDLVNALDVSTSGDTIRIEGSDIENHAVWDWSHWFDFSHVRGSSGGDLYIKVTVPKGTDIAIEDLVGDAVVGDTDGPIRIETSAANATIGRVSEARISLAGSGKISVADVAGQLKIEIAGSGHVTAGHAGEVRADIAGSGDAAVGAIGAGARVDIAGSGDFTASRINGPLRVDIAGSGNVKIADGLANPLKVDIMGAGDLYFGGIAVDPSVSAMGSGNVHIKSYRGSLTNNGMANVVTGEAVPTPPVPPAPNTPPVPPKPPAPPRHTND